MSVFVDTSAFYAQLDPDDTNHDRSVRTFGELARNEQLVTHNYAVVETVALVQARLGLDAARAVLRDILPLIEIKWVDASIHEAATIALLAAGRRDSSLVDWTSFEVMRRSNITAAFAFDRDFVRQGFRVLPSRA